MSKIPTLRFKEFNGDWKENKFENIFNFSTGKNIKQNEASPEFEIPCVRYGELYHMYNEIISNVINSTNLDKSELVFSQGNEILLPSAGEDPLDIGSASALTIPNIAIGRTINILRPLSDNVYSQKYVSYYINQKLRRTISTLAKGSSISNVYNSDLKKLNIFLPSLIEQEKIASFLNQVDTKIEQLTKKEKLLQQYKKGVMQKIFNQEIRFVSDDGSEFCEWEEKNGNEIFETISNKNHNSDLPILAISQEFGAIPRDMIDYKITVTEKSVSSYKVVSIGDFIISLRSFQGGIEYSSYKGICSPAYIILRPFIEINNDFFRLYFKMDRYIQQLNSKLEGIRDGKMISYKYFSEIKLPFPCIEEQTKILLIQKQIIGQYKSSIVYPFYRITSTIGKTKLGKLLQKILK